MALQSSYTPFCAIRPKHDSPFLFGLHAANASQKSKNLVGGFGSKKQAFLGQTRHLFEFDAAHHTRKTLKYGQPIDLF